LHINSVIHRDLKPANILLNDKDNPTKIVICDFGASICLLDNINAYCCTKIGTPYFMSPEQNNSNCYDKKTDIWSLGCILYELITLEKPFEANNINMLNQKNNQRVKQNRYLLGFYDQNTNSEMAFDNIGLKSWKDSVAQLPDYNSPKK